MPPLKKQILLLYFQLFKNSHPQKSGNTGKLSCRYCRQIRR